jgi:hypothetical protein
MERMTQPQNPNGDARKRMSDTQLEHELNTLRDENVRLRHVVEKADAWRESLNLPQQDIGCSEFNEAFANYDEAREGIADLMPQAKCRSPGCDELTYLEGLCDEHHPDV